MGIVVQKYGGSSVADIDRIRAVARRVVATRERGDLPVVVVSAMGRTTDGLMDLARQVSANPGRRELDMLVSVGERITMTLLAMAIQDLGHRAISFTGSQSGIITDDRHFDARIVEVRPARILDALDRGEIVIVAGYQGVSRDREVTTLGRGGSDTTAVALAAALGADYCEICSDVDGVWTADPRIVPEARRIDSLSYGEVLELAQGGARVLAATAVEYARRAGIAIWARSTFSPGPGTRVEASPPHAPGTVVAVAGDPAVPVLRCFGDASDLRALVQAADEAGLRWRHLLFRGGEAELWLDPRCHPSPAAAARGLPDTVPGRVSVEEDLGSVTLVGAETASASDVQQRLLARLQARGVAPVSLAASAFGVSCLLDGSIVPTVMGDLHREFLEPER